MRYITAVVFICVVVCALILLLFFMLDPVTDRLLIIYSLLGMLAVVLGISGIAVVQNTLGRYLVNRFQALKYMGKDGFRAVMKDKVARLAYKGIYAYVKCDLPKAEEYLTKAHDLSDIRQNQVFCMEWLIRINEGYNDRSRLMWCYRKAAEYSPDSPEALSRLGHAYLAVGQLEKAKYYFEQAAHYDPSHCFSIFSLAKIHMLRGEDEEAIATLKSLLNMNANHPLVYAELSTFYAMMGDEENSRECYHKSILGGYEQVRRLSDRLTAIREFNQSERAELSDLPSEYYRRIIKEEEENKPDTSKCSHVCEHCDLNKKCEKDDNDAGNE